jgi:hypothetical protein
VYESLCLPHLSLNLCGVEISVKLIWAIFLLRLIFRHSLPFQVYKSPIFCMSLIHFLSYNCNYQLTVQYILIYCRFIAYYIILRGGSRGCTILSQFQRCFLSIKISWSVSRIFTNKRGHLGRHSWIRMVQINLTIQLIVLLPGFQKGRDIKAC